MKPRDDKKIEQALRALGPMKRYGSLESTGIILANLPIDSCAKNEIDKWRDKFNKILTARSRIRNEVKSTEGQRIDLQDVLDGDPEYFRQRKVTKPAPIKIGINVSAASGAWDIQSLRGGALLAFTDFCKRQGRKFTIEVCYGNGLNSSVAICHVRVPIPAHSTTVSHICLSDKTCEVFGTKLVQPLARSLNSEWRGIYRFYEFEARGIHEYDFVLDRIETSSVEAEEKRILDRLIKLGIV